MLVLSCRSEQDGDLGVPSVRWPQGEGGGDRQGASSIVLSRFNNCFSYIHVTVEQEAVTDAKRGAAQEAGVRPCMLRLMAHNASCWLLQTKCPIGVRHPPNGYEFGIGNRLVTTLVSNHYF